MLKPERFVYFILFNYISLVTYHFAFTFEYHCQHQIPDPADIVHNVHLEPFRVMRKRSIDQKLRIHLVYDESLSFLPNDKKNLIKEDLIPTSVSYWQDTLRVRHTAGPIRLLRQCLTERVRYRDGDRQPYCVDGCSNLTYCGDTLVPEEHLEGCREVRSGQDFRVLGENGKGVANSDFIFYISAKSMDRCNIGTTVAYAAYCQLEDALDRPVAGYVNLCPEAISTKAHDLHQMHSTIKHEILHALGFSAGLFAFFRDSNGEPLTRRSNATGKPPYNHTIKLYQWSDKVVKTVVRPDWIVRQGNISKTVQLVVTPSVLREVRDHFNCSTLEGAELEDQGVIGTALTHWEKRVFENEAMTGTYTQNPIISRITLALMADTGWYHVNYNNAEPYQWGRNLGCNFVTKSCMEWMAMKQENSESVHPYCQRAKKGTLQTECTQERDAVALCNLVEYERKLPREYQHFTSLLGIPNNRLGHYAGSVVLADYCPYVQEFNWKKEETIVRGSRCSIPQNNADAEINYLLEKYGTHSKCFDHSLQWTVKHCDSTHNVEHWGSGCYLYNCSHEYGLLIHVHDRSYVCSKPGQILDVSIASQDWLHQGNILCPDVNKICAELGDFSPTGSLKTNVDTKAPCSSMQVRPDIAVISLITLLHLAMALSFKRLIFVSCST